MQQNDAIATLASAHHDVEASARERHALLAEARWAIRRQHAADAVHRLKARRQCLAPVVPPLG